MKSIRKTKVQETQLPGRSLSTNSLKSGNENKDPNANPNPEGQQTGGDDWLPPKVLLKPPNQLQLSEKELNEEFTRILNANNPHAPHNIARYIFKDSTFKASPNVDHLLAHYEFDGYMIFKEDTTSTESGSQEPSTEEPNPENATTTGDQTDAPNVPATTAPPAEDEKKSKAPLRNQFNFSERAAQTINNPFKDRSTNTEPPPARVFSDTVNQWVIYDAYMEDLQMKEKAAKEKSKAPPPGTKTHKDEEKNLLLPSDASTTHNEEVYYKSTDLRKSLIIIERMANQNTFDDIADDYKYWEDAADEYREGKVGTLLPLWKFVCEKEKKKQVTSLRWNPKMNDMFVVGFGSFDFKSQGGPGMIACFTLKNPSYPEYLYVTESGVLCVDFHPQQPYLIAVGLNDGNVMVYNLAKKIDAPIYRTQGRSGKHSEPVWQVSWQKDDLDDNNNFFSVSSDGRITQWTLLKNELIHTDVIRVNFTSTSQTPLFTSTLPLVTTPSAASSAGAAPAAGPATTISTMSSTANSAPLPPTVEEESLFGLAGACCFDFHKTTDDVFVVGTEEGQIHKCSKSYHNQYLLSFKGHHMGVYSLQYNQFQQNIFLSASADWTVKLWDHEQPEPIMTFDLNSPVGDVAWAPYSSTVFAAATSDGKVFVFDLEINKYQPICEQQIVRKAKLTHIAFNPYEPILLVGDEKGTVIALKLSPNLRRLPGGGKALDKQEQAERLERILLIAMGKSLDK